MKIQTRANRAWHRVLCALLCFALTLGALMLVGCNDESEEIATEPTNETEASTEEAKSNFELNENGLVNVLVFSTDAPKGTKVTAKNTEIIELPAENLPRNVVSDVKEVRNNYTKRNFYKGDYVIASRLVEDPPIVIDKDSVNQEIAKTDNKFIVVTDFVKANTGADLYGSLQTLIKENPGRTLFFPDGEYVISNTLETSAVANKSTSFYFSSNAVLKAADNWNGGRGPLIGLGALDHTNDIMTPGSNFYVIGGIFDGNGESDGITINKGRETLIKDVVIINTRYGVNIPNGTNGSSSDADLDDITVIGNGTFNSTGIMITGLDNTVTDCRILNCATGMSVPNGVFVSNCTVENTAKLPGSRGIVTSGNDCWVSNCMVINCDVAYAFDSPKGIIKQCMAEWTTDEGSDQHVMFKFGGKLRACIISCKADFLAGSTKSNVFLQASAGGKGRVVSPVFDASLVSANDMTANYLETGSVIISPAPVAKKED